jgi:GNAT superfamily N-acetyltransferase
VWGDLAASAFVQGNLLFRSLDEEARRDLVKLSVYQTFAPGERVIERGQAGEEFFLVRDGLASVTVVRDGRAVELGTLEQGAFFGEIRLLTGAPHGADVSAVTELTGPRAGQRREGRGGAVTRIQQAASPEDVALARELFVEYQRAIGVDLCFQGFQAEVAGLPGAYAPPRGRLLLARVDGGPAGCGALRPLSGEAAELKRMWVRPAFRGLGLGRALALALLEAARSEGYARARLDTLPAMTEAQALYRSLGFREVAPYNDNPHPGAIHMDLIL